MKTGLSNRGHLILLTVLLIVVPVIGFGQIGYKYKKWIKNKEYLVATGSTPWEKNLTSHSFNVSGKSFTSVHYMEHYKTKRITQVCYVFPTSYAKEIYQYCSKYGYCINESNTVFKDEDPIFENVAGTIRYKIQGFTRLKKHPERVKDIWLMISTNSHNYKGTFGFE